MRFCVYFYLLVIVYCSSWEKSRAAVPGYPTRKSMQQSPSNNLPRATFDEILSECRKSGNFDLAIQAAEKAENQVPLTASTITGVIRLYGEAGQLGRAIHMLQKMRELKITPNAHHFGALLQAARKAKQWELALELFEIMTTLGVERNTIVYNVMISAAGDAKQGDLVGTLLNRMKEENIPKDTVTFSAAITAWEKSDFWQKSLQLYDTMPQCGVRSNLITLNAALGACVTGMQWRRAIQLLQLAPSRKIYPDSISFSTVIRACGESQQFDIAWRLFHSMEVDGGSRVLVELCKEMAENVVEPLHSSTTVPIVPHPAPVQRVQRDTGTYNAMITACRVSRRWKEAVQLLRCMGRGDLPSDDRTRVAPDCQSFSAAIAACGAVGEWQEALRLFDRMETESKI